MIQIPNNTTCSMGLDNLPNDCSQSLSLVPLVIAVSYDSFVVPFAVYSIVLAFCFSFLLFFFKKIPSPNPALFFFFPFLAFRLGTCLLHYFAASPPLFDLLHLSDGKG